MSSRLSLNSKVDAAEFLKNLKEMFPCHERIKEKNPLVSKQFINIINITKHWVERTTTIEISNNYITTSIHIILISIINQSSINHKNVYSSNVFFLNPQHFESAGLSCVWAYLSSLRGDSNTNEVLFSDTRYMLSKYTRIISVYLIERVLPFWN